MYFVNGVLPALMTGSAVGVPPTFVRRYNVYFQKDPPAFPDFLVRTLQEVQVLSVPAHSDALLNSNPPASSVGDPRLAVSTVKDLATK
jgi:hypothetical protein